MILTKRYSAQKKTFNTKKVRLKHSTFLRAKFAQRSFQYQKGAIKTGAEDSGRADRACFQYQKGAIKTDRRGRPAALEPRLSIPKRCD